MIHLIECHPLFHHRIPGALRASEMSATPALCLRNCIRYLVSLALLGCVFEFPRELLFDTVETGLVFVGEKITSPPRRREARKGLMRFSSTGTLTREDAPS